MDIFTINLDSRPDRWNRVMAHQRAYPWARFHRVPAVPIPLWPIAACTVSHQLAVLLAAVDERPYITVAEDDLEPTRFFDQWPAIVEKAAELGLDYVVGAVATSEDQTPAQYVGTARVGNEKHHVGDSLLVEARNGRGTHLITYFASAYQKILGLQFGAPLDASITMHPELRGGFAFPFVAIQGEGYSDLCARSYDTPKLYEGAMQRWATRTAIDLAEPAASLIAPVVPRGSGIETIARLSERDVYCGRHPKMPAFDASKLMEGLLDG